MDPLKVVLHPVGNVAHVQLVMCGFESLARRGIVTLEQRLDGLKRFAPTSRSDWDSVRYLVVADVEDIGRLVFDVHDSDVVHDTFLDGAVAYFKRGYDPALHGGNAKILPLGLNYFCTPEHIDMRGITRALALGEGAKVRLGNLLRQLRLPGVYSQTAQELASTPIALGIPRVLFFARLWEENGFVGIPEHEVAQRRAQNEIRIACVRELRRSFGDVVTSGILRSPLSRSVCPDALVDPSIQTDKTSYLDLVDRHQICIATQGLLGSTGWKFAEYVAKGRAIVCERMRFTVPGPFDEPTNYLSFASVEECCRNVERLLADHKLRSAMMDANRTYFAGHAEPSMQIWNAIARVAASA